MADFLTTSNEEKTITKYLNDVKIIFEEFSKDSMPKIFVTDMGRALINSVLKVYNNCDLPTYLDWCFDYVTKNEMKKQLKVIYYTCSTHYLKNVIKKVKSKKKSIVFCKLLLFSKNVLFLALESSSKIRIAFICAFALILNSQTINEIDYLFEHIYNMFNNKKLDLTTYKSIFVIANTIRGTDLDIFRKRTQTGQARDDIFSAVFVTKDNGLI